MQPDLWSLYRAMLKSRLFEEAVKRLWEKGHIAGEMHMGLGEEAIVAGIVSQLREGDAMALDHRGTPPLLMRGVDPVLLLREFLGHENGLCAGMGGHMHLFAPEQLAASSGIVGASGPAGAGFGLAARLLRPGSVAVSFFGDGAMNQGMLLESLNLAAVWRLPALFVCKDDTWAITTPSPSVTAGDLVQRARGMGVPGQPVDGADVEAVWEAARQALERARAGEGPTFLHARCVHLEGHFLGDPLLQMVQRPLSQMREMTGPLVRSMLQRKGTSLPERAGHLAHILSLVSRSFRERSDAERDPVAKARKRLETEPDRLKILETEVVQEVQTAVEQALEQVHG